MENSGAQIAEFCKKRRGSVCILPKRGKELKLLQDLLRRRSHPLRQHRLSEKKSNIKTGVALTLDAIGIGAALTCTPIGIGVGVVCGAASIILKCI